jgi:polysaccharide biosynthesis/export protein
MRRILILFVILTIGLAQAIFAQENMPVSDSKAYLIGPGDAITVKVLGEKDFDFEAMVDENGNIEVPFFDKPISAMCKSERDLRTEVTKLLGKYLRNPQVSARVTERNKGRDTVMIYGAVNRQQEVILGRQFRLSELIAASGGATDDAGGIVQVFRNKPPMCGDADEISEWRAQLADTNQIPSRIYSLGSIKSGVVEANPIIYPGDVIVVEKAKPVYITGEVSAPQGVYIKEDGLTLVEAISKVGGIGRDTKVKEVTILRLKPNSKDRESIPINWELLSKNQAKDPVLEPYDIVQVNKQKKSVAQIVMELAIGGGRTIFQGVTSTVGPRIIY